MAAGLKWYGYTDDTGVVYNVQVESAWGDGADNGFVAFDTANPYLPKRWRMRQVHGVTTAGKSARKPIGALTSPFWLGTDTSFNQLDDAGVSHAHAVTSLIGERKRFGR